MLITGTGVLGAAQLVLAPVASLEAASALLFVIGMSFTLWTSNANSLLQLNAPDRLRGRVIGLYFFAFNGAGPLGGLTAGWLASRGGTETAFLVSGAASVAMTAFAIYKLRENVPALTGRRWPVRAYIFRQSHGDDERAERSAC